MNVQKPIKSAIKDREFQQSVIECLNEILKNHKWFIKSIPIPQFKHISEISECNLELGNEKWFISDEENPTNPDARLWVITIETPTATIIVRERRYSKSGRLIANMSLIQTRSYDLQNPTVFDQIIKDIARDLPNVWKDKFTWTITDLLLREGIGFPKDMPTTHEGWLRAGYTSEEAILLQEYLDNIFFRPFLRVFDKVQLFE